MDIEHYMGMALAEAKGAFAAGEVPIGCVIVNEHGDVTGRGRNMCYERKNPLCHAELIAINEACTAIGDWRLTGHTLFVTIEPCPMCAGAIVMSRISRVVYGAKNSKAGCAGSVLDILEEPRFNHQAQVLSGILASECGELMTNFFRGYLQSGSKIIPHTLLP